MAGLLMVHSLHMLHELVNRENRTAEFVEHFALLLDEAGMPRMPARVFAAILADDDGRLTARELAERLSVSPAAVSGAVRYLAQAGMVERGREPGGRAGPLPAPRRPLVRDATPTAARCCAAGSRRWRRASRPSAPSRRPGRRLEETREFFAFLREELPALMERWRARQPTRRAP